MKVIDQLYDGIKTTEIDELTAQQCASMQTIHPIMRSSLPVFLFLTTKKTPAVYSRKLLKICTILEMFMTNINHLLAKNILTSYKSIRVKSTK